MLIEKWANFNKYYQASSFGRVRSLDRTTKRKHKGNKISQPFKGKELKLSETKGYLCCRISLGGKVKTHLVHRIIWQSFNGEIPIGMEIHHIDFNRKNNRLENLAIVTKADNLRFTHYAYRRSKDSSGNTPLSISDVKAIRFFYSKESELILSKIFKKTRETIKHVSIGKTHKSI